MYTLDHLLEDVAHQRGPLTKKGADYVHVWDAFNRYVTAVVARRQTLSVLNFCKIGWRVEEHRQGKAKLRPHFQLAEAFTRAHNLEVSTQTNIFDKHFTTTEEFNFSKAALRYSQNLTKDAIFLGLRAILQRLGEVMSGGLQVSVDFEVGKLLCSARDVGFAFVSELYVQEGLDVPAGALESASYKPSVTFAAPSKDALSLSLRGRSRHHGSDASTVQEGAAPGGWDETAFLSSGNDLESGVPGSEHGELGIADRATDTDSSVSAQEKVRRDALSRHVAQMTMEAASALTERERWEHHLKRCAAEEQRERDWRKAIHHEHAVHLQAQMRQADERRAEGHQSRVEQASLHDFPSFVESPEIAVYDYIRERRYHLKEDLDQQVDAKQAKRFAEKQRDHDIEALHHEASKREAMVAKQEAAERRRNEKTVLAQAWAQDKQIRSAHKAIEEHHKAPAKNIARALALTGLLPEAPATGGEAKQSNITPRMPLPLPAEPDGAALSSARGATNGIPTASRPPSSVVRRMPLGAAGSLALQRQRLIEALRH